MNSKHTFRQNQFLIIFSFFVLLYPLLKLICSTGNTITISILYNSYNEVRDYVGFRLTNLILQGTNPYSLDALSDMTVPFMDLYTLFTPLSVALVCKLTHISIMAGNYFVNIAYVVLTFFHIWLIVKNLFSDMKWLAFLCVFINSATFFAMFGLPILNFRADASGIYLTSLMLLIVYKDKTQTLPLAILSVLLIFTKQVLIVLALPLFTYLFLCDRKRSIRYLMQYIICGFVVIGVVQLLFPLYWTETIYAQFFAVTSLSPLSVLYNILRWSIFNIAYFCYRYIMYLLMILAVVIHTILRQKKSGNAVSFKTFFTWIMEENYVLYLALNIIMGGAFLLYFAQDGGDGYKYCQEILAPSLFLLTIYVWNYCFVKNLGTTHCRFIPVNNVLVAVLCVATAITYSHFGCTYYTRDDVAQLTDLHTFIEENGDDSMYLGMNATQYLLDTDTWEPENIYFNDGQISYFNRTFTENRYINYWFYNEEVSLAGRKYAQTVNDKVQKRQFRLIALCIDSIVDAEILSENYTLANTYLIKTDNGIFEVTVWLPKTA